MLEYLTQLPCETLGQHILGFLELIDIIQWENAAASQKSQQLLRAILPYCTTIMVSDSWNRVNFNHLVCNWFSNRRCRVQFMKIPIESLCEVNFEHSVMYDITLCLKEKTSLKDIAFLNDPNIRDKITKLEIEGYQDPAVMEVLFSLLTNSSVRCVRIKLTEGYNWLEHIKKIGQSVYELTILGISRTDQMLTSITEHCSNLEKLVLECGPVSPRGSPDRDLLHRIARNCTHLRSLDIVFNYKYYEEPDLTAFAEKCPQLEELSLDCRQLTDQSVIALAQHCSKLKKLKLNQCKLTVASLISLSERGLPLEELEIIPSVEVAAQCAHALSRIRKLYTFLYIDEGTVLSSCQYMTRLRQLDLSSSEDHLLVPHLLLQGQCTGLESLTIRRESGSNSQQLCELLRVCPQLHTLTIYDPTCSCDAVLVELARSCPHLQEFTLNSSEVTEKGMLALAAHCRQLREIHIPKTTVTEETVRQLAQHCRRLTKLRVTVREGEVIVESCKHYSRKEIRALRL